MAVGVRTKPSHLYKTDALSAENVEFDRFTTLELACSRGGGGTEGSNSCNGILASARPSRQAFRFLGIF